MRQRFYGWVAVSGLVLACAGGYLVWRGLSAGPEPAVAPDAQFASATFVGDEAPLPPFEAVSDAGAFGNEQLRGRWSLLFFGYTHCPDVCPTTLMLLKSLQEHLATRGLPLPQVVFLSVDPARDTPQLLKEYVGHFDRAFIGATGTDEVLGPLVQHLGVRYVRNDDGQTPHYTVDHTTAIYLIDPDVRLRAVFSPPHHAPDMAADYARLIQ